MTNDQKILVMIRHLQETSQRCAEIVDENPDISFKLCASIAQLTDEIKRVAESVPKLLEVTPIE